MLKYSPSYHQLMLKRQNYGNVVGRGREIYSLYSYLVIITHQSIIILYYNVFQITNHILRKEVIYTLHRLDALSDLSRHTVMLSKPVFLPCSMDELHLFL